MTERRMMVMRMGRERCAGYPRDDNGSHPLNGRGSPRQRPALDDVPSTSNGAETAGSFAFVVWFRTWMGYQPVCRMVHIGWIQ